MSEGVSSMVTSIAPPTLTTVAGLHPQLTSTTGLQQQQQQPQQQQQQQLQQLQTLSADGTTTHYILPIANHHPHHSAPVIIPHGGPFLTGAQVAQALPQRATLVPIGSIPASSSAPHLIQTLNAANGQQQQITLLPNGATFFSPQNQVVNNLSILTPQQLAECGGFRNRVAIVPTASQLQSSGYNLAAAGTTLGGNFVESYIDLSGSLESIKTSPSSSSSAAAAVATVAAAATPVDAANVVVANGQTIGVTGAAGVPQLVANTGSASAAATTPGLQDAVTVGHVFIDAAGKVTSVTPVQFGAEGTQSTIPQLQIQGSSIPAAAASEQTNQVKKVKAKKGKSANEGIKIRKKLKTAKEETVEPEDSTSVSVSAATTAAVAVNAIDQTGKKFNHVQVQHQKFAFSNRNLDHNSEELEEGEIVFNLVKRKANGSIENVDSMDTADDLDLLDDDIPTVAVNTGQLDRTAINIHVGKSHLQFESDGRAKWKCDQCPKVYTTKHNLVTHIMGHSGIKPHCCLICGKFFKQLSHLNTHMLIHSSVKPHLCKMCNKSFTQVSHLKRHLTTHQDAKPHICAICSRGFTYPSELRAHLEKHDKMTDNTCLQCGANFASEKLLERHMQQSQHEKQYDLVCSECNRSFHYPSQLRDHMLKHSNVRPFICQDCGMDFMKEHHLKAHQLTHSGVKPYSCPVCGRSFGLKANMQRHVLLHSNTRQFNCNVCGAFFSQNQTLKAHMVTHAEKKPYQCTICGKEFSRHHNLQGHMTIHTDSRPYKCFCGSTFTLKGNLNRHKKTKHNIATSDCRDEEAAHILKDLSAGGTASNSESNLEKKRCEKGARISICRRSRRCRLGCC